MSLCAFSGTHIFKDVCSFHPPIYNQYSTSGAHISQELDNTPSWPGCHSVALLQWEFSPKQSELMTVKQTKNPTKQKTLPFESEKIYMEEEAVITVCISLWMKWWKVNNYEIFLAGQALKSSGHSFKTDQKVFFMHTFPNLHN